MSYSQHYFSAQHHNNTTETSSSSSGQSYTGQSYTGQSNTDAQYALNDFQPSGVYSGVFEDHQANQNGLRVQMSQTQLNSVQLFQAHYAQNQARYQAVSARTNMPAELIAALHWRESTGDFNTYLHQGDRLGRPAVNEPRNIPIFYEWEEAAVHALQMKDFVRQDIGIDAETRHFAALATYAETYNGLGYHLYQGMESPYVYAGTNEYNRGKYVADGSFSSWHVDEQPGIMPLLGAINGVDSPTNLSPRLKGKEDSWFMVVDGSEVLREGSSGDAVEILQQRLHSLGYTNTPDGSFGPNTKRLVIEFQSNNGLSTDGVVGRGTAGAIEHSYTTSVSAG